jgi:hypothetical protein
MIRLSDTVTDPALGITGIATERNVYTKLVDQIRVVAGGKSFDIDTKRLIVTEAK